jgi:hypothetical protein
MMGLNNRSHEVEAEPGTLGLAAERIVNAGETIKDSFAISLSDTDPFVLDKYEDVVRPDSAADADGPPAGRVFNRVRQKIGQDLPETFLVPGNSREFAWEIRSQES